jgi:fructosamine-3-kinase
MTLPAGAREAQRVGGGDINEAFRVVLADGTDAFVKTRADAAAGEYAAEAAGLQCGLPLGRLRSPS